MICQTSVCITDGVRVINDLPSAFIIFRLEFQTNTIVLKKFFINDNPVFQCSKLYLYHPRGLQIVKTMYFPEPKVFFDS